MIVEFLSCSATGKSTINSLLKSKFKAPKRINAPPGSGHKYSEEREKFRQALAKMSSTKVLEIEHNRQRRCLHRRFNGHWWAREMFKGKLVCWDEGTIQCLGSLFHIYDELPNHKEVVRLLDGWPLPDLVIILDVDKKLVLQRKMKRDRHLPCEMERISQHFDIQKAIIDRFTPAFDGMGIPYFRLANNFDSPQKLLDSKRWKELLRFIERGLENERH